MFVGLILVCDTEAFIFSSQCIAPPPCSCRPAQIDCENRHLTEVPSFKWYRGMSTYHIDVYLNGNQLTTIPSCAFGCPKRFHATEIHMYLNDNQIDQIDTDAFDDIETNITKLDLQNNMLRHLPAALKKFRTLEELNILGNPLKDLDGIVMQQIGTTLKSFAINHAYLLSTDNLTQLQSLILEDISDLGRHWHDDFFDSFKTSLTRLVISSSWHNGMPYAICGLSNLTSFAYINSPDMITYSHFDTAAHVFDDWNSTCIKVNLTHLNLDNNNLPAFPALSGYFPNLNFLSVSHNKIQFIESNAFENTSQLISLDLSNNSFPRIPSAINKLSNLTWLNMSGNHIVSIEDADLAGLDKLNTLILAHNPLLYVTPDAFRNNPLERINFGWTNLVRIPKALLALNHLYSLSYRLTVSFDQNQMECSCTQMSVWKSLKLSYTFYGQCYQNHLTIMEYIRNDFRSCP